MSSGGESGDTIPIVVGSDETVQEPFLLERQKRLGCRVFRDPEVLVRAGRQPRTRIADLFIAATARVHGVPLYTKNLDEPLADEIEILEA